MNTFQVECWNHRAGRFVGASSVQDGKCGSYAEAIGRAYLWAAEPGQYIFDCFVATEREPKDGGVAPVVRCVGFHATISGSVAVVPNPTMLPHDVGVGFVAKAEN